MVELSKFGRNVGKDGARRIGLEIIVGQSRVGFGDELACGRMEDDVIE